jgi:ferritin
MMNARVEEALNKQLHKESFSSHMYLAMASWTENQGLEGSAKFLYQHSDEERQHMLKLVRYINERGGKAIIPNLAKPEITFDSMLSMYESLLQHEIGISNSIGELVHICLEEKDYSTYNFLQWFVSEQMEEEALARSILDKLRMIGNDKSGLYLFDRDINGLRKTFSNTGSQPTA